MNKKILKIIVLVLIVGGVSGFNSIFHIAGHASTVRAVGDLTVDWGVPEGKPIFVVDKMTPGQTETRQVTIINNASTSRPVSIRGVKTRELGDLSTSLDLTISENGNSLYQNSLDLFFTASSSINGIYLLDLNPGDIKKIDFKVNLKDSTGNQFQNTTVVFDLIIGIAFEIPENCQSIEFDANPVFGTAGKDRLRGGNGNDLIVAFEGNDTIEGGNGNDCIIGGNGDDKIQGGNGDDIIYAGSGNDYLDGLNGNDKLFGESGDDRLNGGNGSDYLEGNEGDDKLTGGNGDDKLFGGKGEDSASGDLGIDFCEAEVKRGCE